MTWNILTYMVTWTKLDFVGDFMSWINQNDKKYSEYILLNYLHLNLPSVGTLILKIQENGNQSPDLVPDTKHGHRLGVWHKCLESDWLEMLQGLTLLYLLQWGIWTKWEMNMVMNMNMVTKSFYFWRGWGGSRTQKMSLLFLSLLLKATLHSQMSVRSSVSHRNPSTAWNHHPSSFILHPSIFLIILHHSTFISRLLSFSACGFNGFNVFIQCKYIMSPRYVAVPWHSTQYSSW